MNHGYYSPSEMDKQLQASGHNTSYMLPSEISKQFTKYLEPHAVVGLESHPVDPNFATIGTALNLGGDGFLPTLKMAERVINYSKAIKSKRDHISFFGGNLLGVDRIRFYTSDRDQWFDDILQVDEEYLRECLHKVPSIVTDWVVTSDVFNVSTIWAVHKLMAKFGPNNKIAHKAMVEILVMLQFRFLTSIYTQYFRKPVDEQAAEATYAALTLKFKLRQLGSWGALLRDRAEAFIDPKGIHFDAFSKFDNDDAILYIITDLQTRTRKTVKDMYGVLDKVRSGNLRIQTTSSVLVIDGDKIIRDRVSSYRNARTYLLDVSGNSSSFIKRELVEVVLDCMTTVSENNFLDLLQSVSNSNAGKQRDEVEWMMENTLQHAFNYIASNRIQFNDMPYILTKMRALYMSSKTSDPTLLQLRTRIESYSKRHSKLRAPAALASARTSVMLYFLLRALSSQIYAK